MHRLNRGDRRPAGIGAPSQKFLGGAGIGPAHVRVRMLAAHRSVRKDSRKIGGQRRTASPSYLERNNRGRRPSILPLSGGV
jgi:hypothetical protein